MADNATDTTVPSIIQRNEDLRSLTSFEDAIAYGQELYGEIHDASQEIGDGFVMLDDKDRLLNVGFYLVGWNFTESDKYMDENGKPTVYVIARAMTEHGDKVIITDGSSTGIAMQLRDYSARSGRMGGLLVKRGLRKSEYVNDHGAGTTHYLNV